MQSLPWWSFLGRNRRQVTQETCKMMQHAKLMSSAGLVSAKQEINDAVSELEARPTCIQRVYTNLTRVFNALADHPQVQLAVDSTLATQTRVRLLSELVQIHLRDEEVQWALGRVISLACQVSTRFQCQAGQLEMWNELFAMRSAHPQSIRVQEASLRASEALFRSNEFHITQLRPQQHLDDLVDVMDRFLRIETPRRRACWWARAPDYGIDIYREASLSIHNGIGQLVQSHT
ncbi:hypothetical protein PC116_g1670 [Phytophthora cactorum]|nr:hypothetical protein PC114_g967 [Phytophthora cactorum]KAG4250656.1 hypothetical protein PC116_g1670 [Phytophthora cactorum]